MKKNLEAEQIRQKIRNAEMRQMEHNIIIKILKARAKDLRMDNQLQMAYLLDDCVLEIQQLSKIPNTSDDWIALMQAKQK